MAPAHHPPYSGRSGRRSLRRVDGLARRTHTPPRRKPRARSMRLVQRVFVVRWHKPLAARWASTRSGGGGDVGSVCA